MTCKTTLLLGLLALFVASPAAAQDCEFVPEGKVAKLLEKAADKKKYEFEDRMEFLQDALEEDENCTTCRHELGVSLFKNAKRTGGSFGAAKGFLSELVERCPDYHSDPYYYLGTMHYADYEYEQALTYFQRYTSFPDDDPEKFKRDYDRKSEEVREALPNVEFWRDFYKNDDFEPVRVAGVSSNSDDYLPCLSPDGEIMFYTRRVQRQAKGDLFATTSEEFTWSFREDINQTFDGGEPLPKPFNIGSNNYGGATISVNNREMIIAAKNPVEANKQNIDLFVTRYELVFDESIQRDVYRWSALENLGPGINSERGWEAQPSLSGDGETLYFAKVGEGCKPDGNGDFSHDLFYAERQADGTWGSAQPLPDILNTTGHEKAPYMHSDSKTMYFISNGHLGAGGYDIFYTRQKKDGSWDKPKNIGHPFNTRDDELGLIVSADGKESYFVSRSIRGSRMQDIYSMPLPEEAKPEAVMILKGEVKDEEGNPRTGARVKLTYAQSKEAEEIEVSDDDGTYAAVIKLAKGEDVLMSVEADDLAFNSRVVARLDDPEPPSVVKLAVTTETIETGKPFVLNDIFYATNSADIDPASQLILESFATYLIEHPNLVIEIRGHTDNVGSDDNNLALSMDRAFEVKTLLERNGVTGKRVAANGYGESKPVATNDTAEGRAQNRRTEFVIKKM